MIRLLWDQCEVSVQVVDLANYQQVAYLGAGSRPMKTEQCPEVGKGRVFADGYKRIMCDLHWAKCTAIVDEDGAKHVPGRGAK